MKRPLHDRPGRYPPERQGSLLATVEPSEEDLTRRVGLIVGPLDWHEGFGAGLTVWCGPLHGWRALGDLANPGYGGIMQLRGRLMFGMNWLVGEQTCDPGK